MLKKEAGFMKINDLGFYANIDVENNILIISDLHLTKDSESKNVSNLICYLIKFNKKFDFICINGDLINDTSHLDNADLIFFLNILNSFINSGVKLIIIKGNHDTMYLENRKWKYDNKDKLKEIILNYTNSIFLDNEIFIHNKHQLAFYGLTNSFEFYEKVNEDANLYYEELSKLIEKDSTASDGYIRILLSHACRALVDFHEFFAYFDFMISGHYHNGLIPNFLYDMPSSRGIIGPQNNIFPKYSKGVFTCDNGYLILNGAINPFNEIQPLNNLYGGFATTLSLNAKKMKYFFNLKSIDLNKALY